MDWRAFSRKIPLSASRQNTRCELSQCEYALQVQKGYFIRHENKVKAVTKEFKTWLWKKRLQIDMNLRSKQKIRNVAL